MEKLEDIKNELNNLLKRAYDLGREHELDRVGKILNLGLENKIGVIENSKALIANVPRTMGRYKRIRHGRRGHAKCQSLIMQMMKTRKVISTHEAVKAGRRDGFSAPIVWRALRGFVSSGHLVRLKTGLYGLPPQAI